jgi:hypothetical protein
VKRKGASASRNHSVKTIEQRVGYALLISKAGLIQETKKFSPKKIFRCLEFQQARATVYFIAGNEGLRM